MADTKQVDADAGAETPAASGAKAAAKADAKAERVAARLARRIGAFAKDHGGAEGQIAYIGERGARIVLVGEDGGWGDLVAPSMDVARQAVEKSGITVHEDFDGEFAAKVRTGPYEWSRMAGIQVGGPRNT
ncbi:hypothetical protein ACIPPJ_10780 [Streptomyces sp. NPDC086091]|uniref:hypothetical protein n=1 Tax=Streptomyces sp. NPDC086091 TaxID=3365751 RepID=UPI0038016267